MDKTLTRVAWFIALVLVQVLILNHIFLFNQAIPFLYIYLYNSLYLYLYNHDLTHEFSQSHKKQYPML